MERTGWQKEEPTNTTPTNLLQGNSPIWSLCEAGDALVTGGESGAVVRTAFGKKEAIEVDTRLEETRSSSSTSFMSFYIMYLLTSNILVRMVRRVGPNVLVVGDNGKLVLVSPVGSSLLKHILTKVAKLAKTNNRLFNRRSSRSALGGFFLC